MWLKFNLSSNKLAKYPVKACLPQATDRGKCAATRISRIQNVRERRISSSLKAVHDKHKVEEYTMGLHVDLQHGFQKCSVYRKQTLPPCMLATCGSEENKASLVDADCFPRPTRTLEDPREIARAKFGKLELPLLHYFSNYLVALVLVIALFQTDLKYSALYAKPPPVAADASCSTCQPAAYPTGNISQYVVANQTQDQSPDPHAVNQIMDYVHIKGTANTTSSLCRYRSTLYSLCYLHLDSAGMKGRGKWEIPEKTRRPTTSSGTIPTCENPVTQPGIKPGSPWWKASRLTARPPQLPASREIVIAGRCEEKFVRCLGLTEPAGKGCQVQWLICPTILFVLRIGSQKGFVSRSHRYTEVLQKLRDYKKWNVFCEKYWRNCQQELGKTSTGDEEKAVSGLLQKYRDAFSCG
ncbi:hypothetical protein PR048_020680 [Dryococelus australis]|uniref:Uncharacterized protein n=1 Tax=Dryococelus australis TaxID=614101 RepID=A0ABQ9H704_9NEOP|nr:hypothetical protein PR048_020680 [Dryococelus australis]